MRDLLRFPLIQVNRMRGVGSRTRKELTNLGRRLAERFPEAAGTPKTAPAGDDAEIPAEAAQASVDELQRQLLPAGRTAQSRRDTELVAALLGLRDEGPAAPWPSQSDVARALDVTPVAVSQAVARSRQRWIKTAVLTRLRHDVVDLLEAHGNVMTQQELAVAILARRGSVQEEPLRARHGGAWRARSDRGRASPRGAALDGAPAGRPGRRAAGPRRGRRPRRAVPGRPEAGRLRPTPRPQGDELSAADPLLSPARVIEGAAGRGRTGRRDEAGADRLIELAAAVSRKAALSSRLELYPRGMAADRALRLGARGRSRGPAR